MTELQGWQERVMQEARELNARGEKLCAFIESAEFDKLPGFDRRALPMQFAHMQAYMVVLKHRIAEFENSNSQKLAEAN